MVERHGIMREEAYSASPAWHHGRDDADNHDHNPIHRYRATPSLYFAQISTGMYSRTTCDLVECAFDKNW